MKDTIKTAIACGVSLAVISAAMLATLVIYSKHQGDPILLPNGSISGTPGSLMRANVQAGDQRETICVLGDDGKWHNPSKVVPSSCRVPPEQDTQTIYPQGFGTSGEMKPGSFMEASGTHITPMIPAPGTCLFVNNGWVCIPIGTNIQMFGEVQRFGGITVTCSIGGVAVPCPPTTYVANPENPRGYVIDNIPPFDGNCISTDNAGVIKGIEPCSRAVAQQACAPPSKPDDNGDFCVGESNSICAQWVDGEYRYNTPCKSFEPEFGGPTDLSQTIPLPYARDRMPSISSGFPPGGRAGDVLADDGKGGWKWVPFPPGVAQDKDGNLIEANPQ